MTADPLLETIAKAVRDVREAALAMGGVASDEGIAVVVKARLLSDAGSTQWGVRYADGHQEEREDKRAALYTVTKGSAKEGGVVVRRQVLPEQYGPWEDA